MFGLGTGELIIILGVFALTFGGKRLPELGRGLGQGMRGFRDALKGIDEPEHGGNKSAHSQDDSKKKPQDPAA